MGDYRLTQAPTVNTGMLIRRPVADVFEAFVDPAITSQFWFTKGSGRLEPGQQVTWEWEMYDVSVPVDVKVVEPNERIVIQWPGQHGMQTIEWSFAAHDGGTYVSITATGFDGTGDEIATEALDSMSGFTFVAAGAKIWLEHGIRPNFVPDRLPAGLVVH